MSGQLRVNIIQPQAYKTQHQKQNHNTMTSKPEKTISRPWNHSQLDNQKLQTCSEHSQSKYANKTSNLCQMHKFYKEIILLRFKSLFDDADILNDKEIRFELNQPKIDQYEQEGKHYSQSSQQKKSKSIIAMKQRQFFGIFNRYIQEPNNFNGDPVIILETRKDSTKEDLNNEILKMLAQKQQIKSYWIAQNCLNINIQNIKDQEIKIFFQIKLDPFNIKQRVPTTLNINQKNQKNKQKPIKQQEKLHKNKNLSSKRCGNSEEVQQINNAAIEAQLSLQHISADQMTYFTRNMIHILNMAFVLRKYTDEQQEKKVSTQKNYIHTKKHPCEQTVKPNQKVPFVFYLVIDNWIEKDRFLSVFRLFENALRSCFRRHRGILHIININRVQKRVKTIVMINNQEMSSLVKFCIQIIDQQFDRYSKKLQKLYQSRYNKKVQQLKQQYQQQNKFRLNVRKYILRLYANQKLKKRANLPQTNATRPVHTQQNGQYTSGPAFQPSTTSIRSPPNAANAANGGVRMVELPHPAILGWSTAVKRYLLGGWDGLAGLVIRLGWEGQGQCV